MYLFYSMGDWLLQNGSIKKNWILVDRMSSEQTLNSSFNEYIFYPSSFISPKQSLSIKKKNAYHFLPINVNFVTL